MRTINGYALTAELSALNAGFCQWGFCIKDGHEYFIKELLEPKYPLDSSLFTKDAFERKKKLCEEFFQEKELFRQALARCRTGNNVIILDFFREGSRYYIVTDKIEDAHLTPQQVAALSEEKKEVLIRSLLYSVAALHQEGIIHSDIKADNVLLKWTNKGFLTAKVIDFDSGFLTNQPQKDVHGDFVYLSPEAFLKMNEEDVTLTNKIDIFALGVLFHLYLTGEVPRFDPSEQYLCLALLNEKPIELSPKLPAFYRPIIARMLAPEPEKRPSARSILQEFQQRDRREKQTGGFYIPGDLD